MITWNEDKPEFTPGPPAPPVVLPPLGGTATMAIVSLTSALLGLLILPILLGPLAVITGACGFGHGKPAKGAAMAGVIIGLFDTVVVVTRFAALSQATGY
jgi:uncharacterized protein YqgC (DUF456 family)